MAEFDRAGNNVNSGGPPIIRETPHPLATRVVTPIRGHTRRHYRGFWRRGLRCRQTWHSRGNARLEDLPPTDPRIASLPVCQHCAELGPTPPDP